MSKMELILFDKYLIRTDPYNYILVPVKDGKPAIVSMMEREIKGKTVKMKDLSNFNRKKETYHGNLGSCLMKIKDYELKDEEILSIDDLLKVLDKIDDKINDIKERFK